MGKLFSLVERLKEKEEETKYIDGRFPIFEGKVISVSGEIIQSGQIHSLIDYLPKGTENSGPDLSLVLQGRTEECNEALKKILKRVIVPFSVNPAIFNGTNVRGYLTKINDIESYVLEVSGDERVSDITKILMTAVDDGSRFKFEGFKYVVPLREN